MAVVMDSAEVGMGKLVGLKLEISPEILPRDTSIGTKVFTLLPSKARTVREVKTHLANFILRTPTPFRIYMGEYRIRDEEDAQIFSLVSEPCRLVPVPPPRSALSSTPKPRLEDPRIQGDSTGSSSGKRRVTFFDADLTTSPVRVPNENGGGDVLDHSQSTSTGRFIAHTQDQFFTPPNDPASAQNYGVIEDEEDSAERKKRRRRRHRSKKSKSNDFSETEMEKIVADLKKINGSNDNPSDATSASHGMRAPSNTISNVKHSESLNVLNEETESEDETLSMKTKIATEDLHDNVDVPPTTGFLPPPIIVKRKSADASRSIKKQKLSDSASISTDSGTSLLFSSSCSPSPDTSKSFGKARQDTPIVPRVIRNPKIFDSARKILNVSSNEEPNDGVCMTGKEANRSPSVPPHGAEPVDTTATAASSIIQSETTALGITVKEEPYSSLDKINSLDDVKVGHGIAFKVLELDERYNPSLSSIKEAIVLDKVGTLLTIKYTKNYKIIRTGKYELQNEDDLKPLNSESSEEDFAVVDFADLIEPKFVPSKNVSATIKDNFSEDNQEPVLSVI